MSYLMAVPEMMASAATDVATIGSNLSAAHSAAAPAILDLAPAAADEVSTGIARLFSQYAENFQGLAGRAAAYQGQFVQTLTASAFSYTSIEEINAYLTASANQLIRTLTALPVQALAAFDSWWFRVLFGETFDSVISGIAALPPQEAIPQLLLDPVLVPVVVLLFAWSMF